MHWLISPYRSQVSWRHVRRHFANLTSLSSISARHDLTIPQSSLQNPRKRYSMGQRKAWKTARPPKSMHCYDPKLFKDLPHCPEWSTAKSKLACRLSGNSPNVAGSNSFCEMSATCCRVPVSIMRSTPQTCIHDSLSGLETISSSTTIKNCETLICAGEC